LWAVWGRSIGASAVSFAREAGKRMIIIIAVLVGLIGVGLNLVNPKTNVFESYVNDQNHTVWKIQNGVSGDEVHEFIVMKSVASALLGASAGAFLVSLYISN
jgi:uncharacterized membrane protein